jgi:uncharacterized protein YndB with AHSA1/START domain
MSTFTESILIDAPPATVWAALADIGTIATWHPGLISSPRTNDMAGVGAARHCDISATHSLAEIVTDFEPDNRITFRITQTTLPFAEANIRFRLADHDGGTHVSVSPEYRLKYGLIGRIVDALTVRRSYRSGMRDLLVGLKTHLERHVA